MKRRPIFTEVLLLNAVMVALATAGAALVTGFSSDHIEQLILMIMQANLGLERSEIKEYVSTIVQIIIQLRRGEKGQRYVSEIYYRPPGGTVSTARQAGWREDQIAKD